MQMSVMLRSISNGIVVMAIASMFECGVYEYTKFREQQPFMTRWLGPFDKEMTGSTANELLDHVGKLTQHAQSEYIRGWDFARQLQG